MRVNCGVETHWILDIATPLALWTLETSPAYMINYLLQFLLICYFIFFLLFARDISNIVEHATT